MTPEREIPGTFLKAQIAVSEVRGRQRSNTAVLLAIVASTKGKQKVAIFNTGGTPIEW